MKPNYISDGISKPSELLTDLLNLEWLEVTEARREYFMSEQPRSYTYGKGVGQRQYHSRPFTESVTRLLVETNEQQSSKYNICFLNRYDNQKQHLGWHADDSVTMDHNHPIAVISLGVEREIWWRVKGQPGIVPIEQRQLLKHGSLFIMPAGFQQEYEHRIPKCDRPCGMRISLTFRKYDENV